MRIVLGVVVGLLLMGLSLKLAKAAELEVTPKEGELWVTVTGELSMVNMTAIKDVWKEYALRLEDGEICILIGELAKELEGLEGKQLTISGVLKPRMRYAGELTRAIEIRSIAEAESGTGAKAEEKELKEERPEKEELEEAIAQERIKQE